ncbi:MAG: hypothetical protein JXM70_16475 [Pirellulales bacterium]|nr:hypothetical protein [Pirellulales bacterium]
MRRHYAVLALLVTTCLAAASRAEEKKADSAEKFIKAWVAVFNKNDPEKLLEFYDRSNKTEIIVSSGVRHQGYKAVRKAA